MKLKELLETIREIKGCSCCEHMRVVDVFHDNIYMCTREKEPFTIGDIYYDKTPDYCGNWSICISDLDEFILDEIDEDLEDLGVKIIKEGEDANTTD